MKYICAQPRTLYYAWQVEIMIDNFLRSGINGNDIEVLVSITDDPECIEPYVIKMWESLRNKYNYVRFFYYPDTRQDKTYVPAIYFNAVKQHYLAFPELQNISVFLHDCDIIFTNTVDFKDLENSDVWYLSDTINYIGYRYIIQKGEKVYKDMCDVIGIDYRIPKLMNSNSGGAQHIIKGATYEYWDKVEQDSIKLYRHFCETEPLWTRDDYPIQKWTAGMWALLWNAWLYGFETKVDRRLDFCNATDPIQRYPEVKIFHNAGVVDNKNKLFYKDEYRDIVPFEFDFCVCNFDPLKCSFKYVEALKVTKMNTCLL